MFTVMAFHSYNTCIVLVPEFIVTEFNSIENKGTKVIKMALNKKVLYARIMVNVLNMC